MARKWSQLCLVQAEQTRTLTRASMDSWSASLPCARFMLSGSRSCHPRPASCSTNRCLLNVGKPPFEHPNPIIAERCCRLAVFTT